MNGALYQGRLLDFSAWGQDSLRRHVDLTSRAPSPPDPKSLPGGWDRLSQEEQERFGAGLWCVEESDVYLLGNIWRYSQAIDRGFQPLSSNGDLLFPELQWAPMLKGKGYLIDYDPDSRSCQIDISAYPLLERYEGPCLYMGASPNWGHWMADMMGRLVILDEFPELKQYRLIFGCLSAGQAECLELVGIDKSRLCVLDMKERSSGSFYFSQLAVPSSPPLALAYDWLYERLTGKVLDDAPKDGPERIYLTRRGFFPAHRVFNQDAVEELMESRGFTIVAGETMGVAEIIRLMANAKIVVSPIGAGLGNFLLAPKDAVFIHFVPDFLKSGFERSSLFTNWMRYYYPLRDRLILVFGEYNRQDQMQFAAQHGTRELDVPVAYSLKDIDLAIMAAEKQAVMKGRG
jgi:hypothetical protein